VGVGPTHSGIRRPGHIIRRKPPTGEDDVDSAVPRAGRACPRRGRNAADDAFVCRGDRHLSPHLDLAPLGHIDPHPMFGARWQFIARSRWCRCARRHNPGHASGVSEPSGSCHEHHGLSRQKMSAQQFLLRLVGRISPWGVTLPTRMSPDSTLSADRYAHFIEVARALLSHVGISLVISSGPTLRLAGLPISYFLRYATEVVEVVRDETLTDQMASS